MKLSTPDKSGIHFNQNDARDFESPMFKSAFQRAFLQKYGMVGYAVPLAGEIISVSGMWGMTANVWRV